MEQTKDKKIISKLLKAVVYIAISFACLLTLFLLYYVINSQIHADDESYKPNVSIYTIVSPSMTPVINVYDVVVNVKAEDPSEIEVGDIITYKSQAASSEGMTITHRVIAIDQLPDGTYEYLTQGDNNSEPDSLYVTFDNVIGKEIMILPAIGRLQFLIANHKWWLILLIIPIGIYLIKEIFKLIDLFNLRNKVDRVTGEKEESILVKKKAANIERKEKLREEIENRELARKTITRSKQEPEGFLEKYTETIVSVSANKYDKRNKNKTIKPTKQIEEEEEKEEKIITPPVEEVEVKEDIKEEIKEQSTNDQYEILDTDELSSKIKEYDSKIHQLDKMIKDMENISSTPLPEEQEEPEKDDFLQGNKIKVIKVELTNNNEEVKKARRQKKEEQIDLSDTSTLKNPNKKIARPEGEDIKTLRSNINNQKVEEPKKTATKKDKLNLNPRTIKKVNRPGRTRSRRTLNLNPESVKKVRRPRNTKVAVQTETKKPTPRKKDRIIKIEKIK